MLVQDACIEREIMHRRRLRWRSGAARKKEAIGLSLAIQFNPSVHPLPHRQARLRETGSVAPGQMGGHKPKSIRDENRTWLVARIRGGATSQFG